MQSAFHHLSPVLQLFARGCLGCAVKCCVSDRGNHHIHSHRLTPPPPRIPTTRRRSCDNSMESVDYTINSIPNHSPKSCIFHQAKHSNVRAAAPFSLRPVIWSVPCTTYQQYGLQMSSTRRRNDRPCSRLRQIESPEYERKS